MPKRSIHVSHLLQPGAPTESISEELRRKFADLGWTVTFYGGVSPDWDALHIESEDHELDHPTLIATLASSCVPLYERHASIYGDLLLERQYVDATKRRDAKIGDLRLEILDITADGPKTMLPDRLIYPLRVRCTITPCYGKGLQLPLDMNISALRADDQNLGTGGIRMDGGSLSAPQQITIEIPASEQAGVVNLLVKILDVHRAGEVVFQSLQVEPADIGAGG
jgi:hypothetical protein